MSEVVDNTGRELTKNWGRGEPEREGIGVEEALEATEEWPEGTGLGGSRKCERLD